MEGLVRRKSLTDPPFKLLPDKWDKDTVAEHFIIHYRWVLVIFLLPLSFVYDIYHYARSYIVFKLSSAPKQHLKKVGNPEKFTTTKYVQLSTTFLSMMNVESHDECSR